jgi:multisubunit Na+/H+ antiporter MnhB subunit
MSNNNPWIWIVIGIVIIFCIIGGIIMYNWFQQGQSLAESGDMTGWLQWFAGGIIVVIVIGAIVALFSKRK